MTIKRLIKLLKRVKKSTSKNEIVYSQSICEACGAIGHSHLLDVKQDRYGGPTLRNYRES